jgi:phosphatidylserine/phosphatidylglycerophosphate/cardiolipin synthase-like enzyme
MVQECSQVLNKSLDSERWVHSYSSDSSICVVPDVKTAGTTSIRIIEGRNEMPILFTKLIEASKKTIDFSFCYLWTADTHVQNIFFVLLVDAAKRGVKVKIQLELNIFC